MDKPSIDRIDNDGNYEYGNCQYIELSINSSKDKKKAVIQYDLNNNFIREWNSITEASNALEINISDISNVANHDNKGKHKLKTAGGFKWRCKEAQYV